MGKPPEERAGATERMVAAVARVARTAERPDLVRRLRHARDRLRRPAAAVAVIGEFKQGKSMLVNGLLGEPLLPVDDDLATAVLIAISHADQERFVLHGARNADAEPATVTREAFRAEVSEAGNPGNQRRWQLAEVGLPSPVLELGMTVIDTPGIGGAGTGYAAAVSALLPAVDAVVYVSDASAELTRPEVEFLQAARRACPSMLVALTKIDLYPEWRRILDLDGAHLADARAVVPMYPVSATLRLAAVTRGSAELNEESGYPALLAAISDLVLDDRRTTVEQRAIAELRSVVDELRAISAAERRVLEAAAVDPKTLQHLADAQQRLRELQAVGARWQTVLAEGMADLRADCDYALRTEVRELWTEAERELETDPAGRSRSFADWLQPRAAERIGAVGARLTAGADEIARRIAALVQETAGMPQLEGSPIGTASVAWPEPADSGKRGARRLFESGFGLLRGVQGGAFMIGFFGSLLGLTIAVPISLAVGSAFGIKQLADERRRQTEQRRAQLKAAVRQALDRLQFEATSELQREAVRLQRALRDHFERHIGQMLTSSTAATASLREAAQRERGERSARAERLSQVLRALDELRIPAQGR